MNIIEPTLRDQTGHCFSLLQSILQECGCNEEFRLWMHRDAAGLFDEFKQVIEYPFFSRKIRKLQAFNLYRKLLKNEEAVFLPTATTTDLMLLDWAMRVSRMNAANERLKVKAYMHWLYLSSSKERRLKKIAERYANLEIACPTEQISRLLKECGFEKVKLIPYPMTSTNQNIRIEESQFEKVLVAGAARLDKGFRLIVEIVDYLQTQSSKIPITIQCSPTYKGHHPEEIQLLLQRMKEIAYPQQELISNTMDQLSYGQLFSNSIVLQPYDVSSFADRVSGVTLDALRVGSPVVTIAGTWIASVIERFDAGIVMSELAVVKDWLVAIEHIRAEWSSYSAHAKEAGRVLSMEHDPRHLANWICE